MNSPCNPPNFQGVYIPCPKRAELHAKRLAEWQMLHPIVECGVWCMFWCWVRGNCREETNDKS